MTSSSLLLFGAVLVLVVSVFVQGLEETSSGNAGETCGPINCVHGEAFCYNGQTCRCHPRYYGFGNGYLNCYRKNEFRTEVLNDPRVKTFNNISIDLPIPCRYLLTHAVTEYKDKNRRVVGSCEFMVHVFHKKVRGKFYVRGYDVAIRVECNNGSRYEMTFRKYGWAENGNYNFVINGTDGFYYPNGPYLNDKIDFRDPKTNLRIQCKIDKQNNLAKIVVKKCGFRVRFRPYDAKLRQRQRQVPGMAAAYSCAHRPMFESVDKVLSPPPKAVHNGFDIDSILIPGMGRMETLMYRAYMSGIEQNQPMPNPACAAAKDALLECNNGFYLRKAFYFCRWILRSPRFIRCYDNSTSGVYIQDLFNRCVSTVCGIGVCNDVIQPIVDAGCADVRGYSEKQQYLEYCGY